MGTGLVSILILQCIVGEKHQQWQIKTPKMAKVNTNNGKVITS